MPDGTKVRIITLADGTVVRKIIKETEGQKKLRELKRLKEESTGLADEEAKVEVAKRELKMKEEKLQKLKEEKEKLSKKEEFKPPGVKGKVMKRIVDENGVEHFVEVDLENEIIDENADVYEEVIDEFGNKKMVKIDKSKLAEIKN